jgi:hypothetical protein
MQNVLRAISCASVLIALTTPVFAQTPEEPSPRLRDSARNGATVLGDNDVAAGSGGAAQTHQRDSLWNGVLVGAGLGAMPGILLGIAQDDKCRGCSGFNTPLTYGVLTAGIGAGIGAAVDALFQRRAKPTARPSDQRRVRLVPQLSRDVRGITGSIQF